MNTWKFALLLSHYKVLLSSFAKICFITYTLTKYACFIYLNILFKLINGLLEVKDYEVKSFKFGLGPSGLQID